MTLRKYALLSLALLAILPGCEKSFVSDDEIAFSPLNQKATKAIMTGTAYTDKGFVVHAWRNFDQIYFQDAEVVENSGIWESNNFSCYWPIDGRLDFTAYSPLSAKSKGVSIPGNGVITANGYSITTAADMGIDLCYATASRVDCRVNKQDPVDIVFHHALALVEVNISMTDTDVTGSPSGMQNTVSIRIDRIQLQNIYSIGNFSFNSNPAANHWSSHSNLMNYDITAPNGESGVAFVVIPQTLGTNTAIKVDYSIIQTVTNNGAVVRTIETSHEGLANIGSERPVWNENQKIVYNLILSPLHPIKFSANYSEWNIQDDYIYQF